MAALKRAMEAAGTNLFKFWNDPMGTYLYYYKYPYAVQQKEMDVHRALMMMANLTTI